MHNRESRNLDVNNFMKFLNEHSNFSKANGTNNLIIKPISKFYCLTHLIENANSFKNLNKQKISFSHR